MAYDSGNEHLAGTYDRPERLAPSFTRALLTSVAGLMAALGLALTAAIVWQGTASTDEAARQEIGETVTRLTGRLQILIDAAEMTAASVERVARTTPVTTDTLRPTMESLLAAFDQRPELSFLGLVLPDTGEYGNLERTADGDVLLWLFPGDRESDPTVRNFRLTGEGFVPHQSRPANGYDPRRRPFFRAAVNGPADGVWMPAYQWIVHTPDSEPLWGFSYVKAIRDAAGKVTGVLDTDFDMLALNDFLTALAAEYGTRLHVVELGASPRLIGAPGAGRAPLALPAELAPLVAGAGQAFIGRMELEGERRWVAARRMDLKGGVSWLVVASRSAPFIEAPLRRQLFQVLGMDVVIALGLLLVSLSIARRFGRPLAELEQRVARIGDREPDSPAVTATSTANSFRETQLLSGALDRMAVAVREQVMAKEQQLASLALKGAIFDFSSAAIFSIDHTFAIVEWNAAAERLFGLSRDKVIGQPLDDIVSTPDGPADWAAILATTGTAAFRFIGARGAFDAELRSVTFAQEGRDIHTFVLNDISERKHIEQRLRQERDYADAVLNSLPGVFYHYDENVRLVRWNRNLERVSGHSSEELTGADPMMFFPDDEKARVADRIAEVFEHGESTVEADYLLKDGRRVPYLFTGVRFEYDGQRGFVGVGYDITERKQAESRIHHLAMYDDLTGLPNRNLIQDLIGQATAHARRTGRLLALLYLDLDRFKVVNDGYGHLFGDAVLKAAGAQLVRLVDDGGTVARLGGDEFLILLTGLSQPADAEAVARRIVASLNAPLMVQERTIHLSGSIGMSVFPDDGESADTLIDNADMAMYRAKDLGRNTYQFFTRAMTEEAQRRVSLETQLRSAAESGQLHLVYQPKVNLLDGRISGCEALLRWQHPELGPVSPAHFIPIAEESGLIVPIGDWVLRTACTQARIWMDAGLPPFSVAVNISVCQFLQQDVVAWVTRTLQETGLPPTWLELEITESLIAQDIEKVTDTIDRLKDIGVKLSIDDFGTGYSSLNYLKRFRVDTLKIDQSFVRNMLTETEDSTIVLAVIALAHSLNFKVIAEGVETREHCRVLRSNGCDEIQGYHFSKPVLAAEFEAMLREGRQLG